MSESQNQQNCSFCLAFISNASNASHLKCEGCLRKLNSIPSGFQFKTVMEFKEYECPICLALIENAIELPCTHLVCKACAEFYEKGELQKLKDEPSKAKFICSVCQVEYRRKKKKMVGSIDRVIQTSLKVKCLQEECDWTGCIMDYKYHEKDCKYIMINCQHLNCEIKVQRQLMDSHVERCPLRLTQCEYCEEMVVYQDLQQHHEQCSQFPVSCPNEDCVTILKRSEIKAHCETICEFQQINCQYSEVGCPFKGIRGKMHQHSEKFKFNHEFLLLSTVKNLKEKSDQSEEKLKEKDLQIEQLKEMNIKKDEILNALRQDFKDLKSQLENVCKQLTSKMEGNEEQTNNRLKEINETQQSETVQFSQFKEDIDNLKTFAERTSKLHYTLSEKCSRRNNHYSSTLLQEDYDEDKDVTQWNEMIKEVVEDDNECKYLETLKASINQYKETIYSSTFEGRLENFCYFTHLGVFRYPLVRIGCPDHIESICVESFGNYNGFEKEAERKDEIRTCKVQNDYDVCSYVVGDCLHIVLVGLLSNKVFLLHKSNERAKLNLPNGKEVNIDDIDEYRVEYSFVFYFE